MAKYNVKVVMTLEYEVEADNEADAEQQGYKWQEYLHHYDGLDSIEVEEVSDEEEDGDNEPDGSWMDADALASAGWGTDEDYGYYGGDE